VVVRGVVVLREGRGGERRQKEDIPKRFMDHD